MTLAPTVLPGLRPKPCPVCLKRLAAVGWSVLFGSALPISCGGSGCGHPKSNGIKPSGL
ncbi:MAG: hypothetical protein V4675_05170 [Verrucomicrobiota bacterium]